jgi:hypothetical protein
MVRVDERGVKPFANLWEKIEQVDANGDGDKTPTALIKHRDAFYIGTLGRIPRDFAAYVYRLSADGLRLRQVASGLHGVLGIAFDKSGRLYAVETTAAGVNPPLLDPTVGRLVRVEVNGALTEIVSGLAFPTALLAGTHGEFYISNCGYHCDDLSNFPPRRISLETGQVVKVVIPGVEADPD